MSVVEVISAAALLFVAALVVVGARRGGWRDLTNFDEYQRGEHAV
jgi:hypothetical protein